MKKNKLGRRSLSLLLALVLVCSMLPTAVVASEAENWAWDAQTGKLAVDYENYLSQHDLVYTAMPTDGEIEGMPVANGQTGAQVWQDDGIRMQIHSVDNAPHSAFSAAQVRLATTPTLDDSEGFEQRLNLYDGHISIKQNDGFTAEVFGLPNSETLAIHVTDTREDVRMVTFDIEMWQTSDSMIDGGGTTDSAAWKTVNYYENGSIIGFTKGISAKEPYGYAFAATVEGAEFDIAKVDDLTARLYITMPEDGDYTIYMSAASRLHLEMDNVVGAYETANYTSTAKDVFNKAADELQAAKNLGQQAAMEQFNDWWHNYWESSFVRYQTSDAAESDYLENYYYLMQYQLGGGAYAVYPEHFMRGVFTSKKDTDVQWNMGYWHYNQRAVYHPFLASNHVEGYLPYLDFYNNIRDTMVQTTEADFGYKDALKTTETVRWDGDNKSHAIYRTSATHLILTTGPEMAENMYYAYKYTQDEALLKKYYEYIKLTVNFIVERVEWDETSGMYRLYGSNSLEACQQINNSTAENAAIRSIIPIFVEAAKILSYDDDDAELINAATEVLEKLEPIATITNNGEKRYATHDVVETPDNKRNEQCPELELVYPHNLVGVDSNPTELEMAINTYNHRYDTTSKSPAIWCVDGIHEARLGLGNAAHLQMGEMISFKQKRINGYCYDGNGKLESMGLHISTMNEMLLQSYDDVIRVFPAVPDNFEGAFTLLASGGFLVSSEYADGAARYIGINSQYGGEATVKIPWAGDKVLVNGSEVAVTDGRITIDTTKGESYLIQPVSAKDVTYTTVAYTGAKNTGIKEAFGKKLGISTTSTKRSGRVEASYDFEDDITDGSFADSINSNNAVIHGTVTKVARDSGYAAEFKGNGAYLKIAHSATFDPMKNFVVSFDMNSTSNSNMTILDKYGDAAGSGGAYLDIYGGVFRVYAHGQMCASYPAAELLDGNWHTVKVDYNTSEGKVYLYFDSELKTSGNLSDPLPEIATQAALIGCNRGYFDNYVGLLDNFNITQKRGGVVEAAYGFEDGITDGSFTDSINDNNAVIHGTVTKVARDNGYAAEFHGNGDYLTIAHSATFDPMENFVVSFDMNSTSNSNMTILDKYGGTAAAGGAYLDISGGTFRVYVHEQLGVSYPAAELLDGNWHTVKVEFNTSESKVHLYFDSELKASGTLNGPLPEIANQPALIGCNRGYFDNYIGLLDNFSIGELVPTPIEPYVSYDFEDETMDGYFTDALNGHNAKTNGNAARVADPGREGYAVKFSQTGDWLDISNSENFGEMSNFTVSFDMKTANTTDQMCIYDKYGPGSIGSFYLDIYDNNLRVIMNQMIVINTPVNSTTASVNLRDNQWHSVEVVIDTDSAAVEVYFDDKLAASSTHDKPAAATTQQGRIGSDRNGGIPFIGMLDNFRIEDIAPKENYVSYDFEDETTDGYFTDALNGHNAKINGNAARVADSGREGYVVQFSQTGDWLDISNSENFGEMSNFAVSFDMKTANTTDQMCIYDKYGPGSIGSFYLDIYDNNLRVIMNQMIVINTPVNSTTASVNLRDNQWHSVEVVIDTDSAAVEVYFDDKLAASSTHDKPAAATTQQGRIGSDRNGGIPFIGMLDNFCVVSIEENSMVLDAKDDTYVVSFDKKLTVPGPGVLTNDASSTKNLTAEVTTGVSHGTLRFFGDGGFAYESEIGFIGEDSFTYTVSDGKSSGTATVTLNVTMSEADRAAVDAVEDLIEDLPAADEVELTDEEAIEEARKALDDLTDAQEAVVSDEAKAKLEAAEDALDERKEEAAEQETLDKAAAKAVEDAINALPSATDLTLDDEEDVAAAREALTDLTDEQEKLVSDAAKDKLAALEDKLDELQAAADKAAADQKAADAVEDLIDALPDPDEVQLSDKDDIEAAREAYDDLTDEQKALVTPAVKAKLEDVEEAYEKRKQLQQITVLDTIVAIGGAATGFPFDDVKRTDWFYDEVKDAWNNDLIDGVTKDAFMPEKELTVAQAIKLAAALHQKDYYGYVTLKNGYPNWYSTYVDYAVTMGVIDSKYQSYNLSRMNAAVSREEFVSIFFGAMNNYTAWNEVADNAIPDVKMNDAFADEIYTFYRAGILTGSDAKGTFHPDSSIKRSEVAAILIRMYDTTARQSVTLK